MCSLVGICAPPDPRPTLKVARIRGVLGHFVELSERLVRLSKRQLTLFIEQNPDPVRWDEFRPSTARSFSDAG